MLLKYYIDGIDLATYGIGISGSSGITDRAKPKAPVTVSWETYNGVAVDLSARYYEARDIELDCFVNASSNGDFIAKCNTISAIFDQTGTRRLSIVVDANEPLVYEVYNTDEIRYKKEWRKGQMVATFTLKLREAEPLKRVIKYTRISDADKTATITVTSEKLLSIYWGDGTHTFDAGGTAQTYSHQYATNGTYYIIVAGNIDEITSLTYNGTLVWNKL